MSRWPRLVSVSTSCCAAARTTTRDRAGLTGKATARRSDNVGGLLKGVISSYNHVKDMKDYGFEVGGPILRDRLFVWGAYGRTEPKMQIFTRDPLNVRN